MGCRHQLGGDGLRSDCAPLAGLTESVLDAGVDVHAMHDPTRGGVATVCNEVAVRCGCRLVLVEDTMPVRPQVRGVCDLLGLDPLYVACEGRALLWVAGADAHRCLAALQAHPLGRDAAVIGTVVELGEGQAPVVLRTAYGTERPLDVLSGSELPRIC